MTPLLGWLGIEGAFLWQLGVLALGAAAGMLLHFWRPFEPTAVTNAKCIAAASLLAAMLLGAIVWWWMPEFSARDDTRYFRRAESILVPGHRADRIADILLERTLAFFVADDLAMQPLDRLSRLRTGWRGLCAMAAALFGAMLVSLLSRWRGPIPALAIAGIIGGCGLWVHAAGRFPEAILALALGLLSCAAATEDKPSPARGGAMTVLFLLGAVLHPAALAPAIACATYVILKRLHTDWTVQRRFLLAIGGALSLAFAFLRSEPAMQERFPLPLVPSIAEVPALLPSLAVVLWEFTPVLLITALAALAIALKGSSERAAGLAVLAAIVWMLMFGGEEIPHIHQRAAMLLPVLAAAVLCLFPGSDSPHAAKTPAFALVVLLSGVLALPVPYLAGRHADGERSWAMLRSLQELAPDDAMIVAGAESDLAELLRLASPTRRWEIATLEGPEGALLPVTALRRARELQRPLVLNTAWDSYLLPPGESVESLARAEGFRFTEDTPRNGTFVLLLP